MPLGIVDEVSDQIFMYARTVLGTKKWGRSTSPAGLRLICLPLRLVRSPLPTVGLYPGGRRSPRAAVCRRSITLTLASPTTTSATASPSTATGLYFLPPLLLVAPHFLWLPILFPGVPFARLNLFHLPACALLSCTVDTLLYLSYPSLHGFFFFLALFERILVRLHVLQDQPCQSDPRRSGCATNQSTLLDPLVVLSDSGHASGKLIITRFLLPEDCRFVQLGVWERCLP